MKSPNAKRDSNSSNPAPLDAVRQTARQFEEGGIDAPRLCAELLLAHALDLTRTDLYRLGDSPVSSEGLVRFDGLVQRRLSREPLQHLLGSTEFWSLPIRCDARALVPRPETELLVQAALGQLKGIDQPRIADLGTGTGCITVALAHELPGARIFAVDLSADALALAGENVRHHGLGERVELLKGDLVAPLVEQGVAGDLDLVVCNPPYIAEAEMDALQPEVRDHDPHTALSGGSDGLRFYRRLFEEVPEVLKDRGALVLELGDGQAGAISSMAAAAGWRVLALIRDAASIDRVCVAKRI